MYILVERTDWGGKYSFTSFGKHYIKWNIFFFHCLGRNGLVDSESEFSDWSGRHKCSLQIYDSSCSCGGGERGKEEESRLPYTEEEIELHYKSRTFIYWTIESRRERLAEMEVLDYRLNFLKVLKGDVVLKTGVFNLFVLTFLYTLFI